MKQRRWLTILRWLCVLPAVCVSFAAAFLLSGPYAIFIRTVLLHMGLESPNTAWFQFDLDWDGALAAVLFVLSGTIVAPSHRRVVALALFGLGAFLTPGFIELWNIQSSHLYGKGGHLYIFWPIVGTYVGGALAVAGVFMATRQVAARSA